MAQVLIRLNGEEFRVPCSELISLIRSSFSEESRKTSWAFKDFCKLLNKVAEKDLVDYLFAKCGISVDTEISECLIGTDGDSDEQTVVAVELSQDSEAAPILFTSNGIIRNCFKLNKVALRQVFEQRYNSSYNFATIEHAREQLNKLERKKAKDLDELSQTGVTRVELNQGEGHSEAVEMSNQQQQQQQQLQQQQQQQFFAPMADVQPQMLAPYFQGPRPFVQTPRLMWPTYDGLTDAEDHVYKFEKTAKLANLNEVDTANYFSTGLSGSANIWYRNNEASFEGKTWEEIKQEFLNNFKKVNTGGSDWIIFNNRMQLPTESPLEYIENKIFLARNLEPKLNDQQLIEWIIQGMLPYLSQQVYMLGSTTLADLKKNVSKLLRSLSLSGRMAPMPGSPYSVYPSFSTIPVVDPAVVKRDEKLEKVEKLLSQLVLHNEGQWKRGSRPNSRNVSPRNYGSKTDRYNRNSSRDSSYDRRGRQSRDYEKRSYSRESSQNRYRSNSRPRSPSPFRPRRDSFNTADIKRREESKDRSSTSEANEVEKTYKHPNHKERSSSGSIKCGFCNKYGHHDKKCHAKRKYLQAQLDLMEN